jgi:hypothetical protein
MSPKKVTVIAKRGLEEILKDANDSEFPLILKEDRDNTISYPERYDLLKTKLGTAHDNVIIGATLSSLESEIQNETPNKDIYDRITLLNKHGKGHIELVINRASDLANCIDANYEKLTAFEVFILLCAIQIHDIGNTYGREAHQTSFKDDFYKFAGESFITEPVLQSCIFAIAKAHGGKINDDADTIKAARLHDETLILGKPVRQCLLAVILRFADELADDSTRASEISGMPNMPKYSQIFHAYSSSLHTVKIERVITHGAEPEEAIKGAYKKNAYLVKLCYFLHISEALQGFLKQGKDDNGKFISFTILLIRELIKRTEKMERERRYCSRYFIPHIILRRIEVEIEIDLGGTRSPKQINYTLQETGYPKDDAEIPKELEADIADLERINESNRGETNE